MARFPTEFYSNTIAYMLAYAVYHRYDTLYLYGIDMMNNSTYLQEKGGVEYWMGICLGQGIQVINTIGSATGKTFNGRMYGHWGAKKPEKLYAPLETIRTAKASNSSIQWMRVGEEYQKVEPPKAVAGN